jgi:tight adherence protein C
MLDLVLEKLGDAHFMAFLLAALGCAATALTVVVPLLQTDNLSRRIRAVGDERERIRQRERERLAAKDNRTQLRYKPSTVLKRLVDTLNLTSWLSTETAKETLAKAGFRGSGAEYAFVAGRLIAPIAFAIIATVYIFFIAQWEKPLAMKLGGVMAAVYLGVKAPEIYLRNATTKRQKSIERAYPNTLDLMLICAESGMSIEHTVRKVSGEIGIESVEMAEEMTLLAAEMSYLPDRRTAFENLNTRTGLESIRSLSTVMIQSERYGTPLGAALRVLSQESRDHRMNLAEKKAAALPPTLTVPMILFFLPGLFAAILTPAAIQINNWN